MKGRKRHLLVDTLGLIWGLIVLGADIQGHDGARLVVKSTPKNLPKRQTVWTDGAHGEQLIEWVKQTCDWLREIVKRSDDATGFEVLPNRWIVERTFGWFR